MLYRTDSAKIAPDSQSFSNRACNPFYNRDVYPHLETFARTDWQTDRHTGKTPVPLSLPFVGRAYDQKPKYSLVSHTSNVIPFRVKRIQLHSNVCERNPRPTGKWLVSVKEFANELFPDPVLPTIRILMAEKHKTKIHVHIEKNQQTATTPVQNI
jgi:hypothetical protein